MCSACQTARRAPLLRHTRRLCAQTLSRVAARRAEASKETIYDLHASDPVMYNAAKLAQDYGVRQQRIIAILTLKKARRVRSPLVSPG